MDGLHLRGSGGEAPRSTKAIIQAWRLGKQLDELVWTGESFIWPATLNVYLGIPPTAKSTHLEKHQIDRSIVHEGMAAWNLPGQGEPYPTCGDPILYICPKCGTWKEASKNCRRATCPKCYHTWCWIQAKRTVLRLKRGREIFKRELGRAWRIVHFMISVPRGEWDRFDDHYPSAKRKAYKLLKKAGIKGGAMIPHPWRWKCASCGGDMAGSWTVNEETGKPEQKNKYCVKCGSERAKRVKGPHWHIIGYGWTRLTKEIEKATGYVIKNIGLVNNPGGTVWYQLTHCGIREGRQVVTYFGMCAYNKFKSPPFPPHLVLCPQCEAIMVLYTPEMQIGKPPP